MIQWTFAADGGGRIMSSTRRPCMKYQVVSLPSSAAVASYCNDSDSADGLFQMEISPPETCISGRSLAGGGSAKWSGGNGSDLTYSSWSTSPLCEADPDSVLRGSGNELSYGSICSLNRYIDLTTQATAVSMPACILDSDCSDIPFETSASLAAAAWLAPTVLAQSLWWFVLNFQVD
ncbi:unnamed protein product [Durusdinium trenchii]|uniref:Uncharacterized protein n=2 Tax=Durusdinium trenchii TaxID=1381693 RepID=A0ABP0HF09_9DINO